MFLQANEHKAFAHAQKFLDAVNLSHIFMEWEELKRFHPNTEKNREDRKMVEDMIHLLIERKFSPLSLKGDKLDVQHWNKWPFDIVWTRT